MLAWHSVIAVTRSALPSTLLASASLHMPSRQRAQSYFCILVHCDRRGCSGPGPCQVLQRDRKSHLSHLKPYTPHCVVRRGGGRGPALTEPHSPWSPFCLASGVRNGCCPLPRHGIMCLLKIEAPSSCRPRFHNTLPLRSLPPSSCQGSRGSRIV